MYNSQWVEVNCEGEVTKAKYFGRFEIKPYLTHKEKADAVRLSEVYCRGITSDQSERAFLTSLAYIKMHIVSTDAPWWLEDGLALVDEQPVYELVKILNGIQNPKKEEAEQKA